MMEASPDHVDGEQPDLSVVVTIVDGGEMLDRHLAALTNQEGECNFEIIVPYDITCADAVTLAEKYSHVRFLALGRIREGMPGTQFDEHALYDIRRSEGLKRAKGRLIAILEDRGIPRADWAASMIRLHETHSAGVIGGAVINGVDQLMNWAIFFCDFGRYQPPLSEADPEYVTDVNICYKRASLMSIMDIWENAYHEPLVNTALRRAGHGLLLSDEAVVTQQRTGLRLGSLVSERFHWGRVFGRLRGGQLSRLRCIAFAALTPSLPLVLFVRHFRQQLKKGHHVDRFVKASPITALLLMFWSVGECFGYLEIFASGTATTGAEKRDAAS